MQYIYSPFFSFQRFSLKVEESFKKMIKLNYVIIEISHIRTGGESNNKIHFDEQ